MTKRLFTRFAVLVGMLTLLALPSSHGLTTAGRDYCSDCFRNCYRYTGQFREVCMNGCIADGCPIP
jgi:hypothetical protein